MNKCLPLILSSLSVVLVGHGIASAAIVEAPDHVPQVLADIASTFEVELQDPSVTQDPYQMDLESEVQTVTEFEANGDDLFQRGPVIVDPMMNHGPFIS